MDVRHLGEFGEERAVRFLRRKGYRIVERNYRCRQGEIDIIARKRDILAFVEVKLRRQPRFDVIEIYAPSGERGPITINHLENAFM